ncbi:MAG: hypothetical protein AB8G86_14640 [Saprospiraceae bacterium]
MFKKIVFFFFFQCTLLLIGFSQTDTIFLKNPSFEGIPRTGLMPKGWTNCNENPEKLPDVHPSGVHGVNKRAVNGDTYMALLTDENGALEKISQELTTPLNADQCYFFKLSLCRTSQYKSTTRILAEEKDYSTPIKLTIWGGDNACQKVEKLAESNRVYNTNWLDFVFTFQPKKGYKYLILEAGSDDPVLSATNGHVLIDNATPITPLSCDSIEQWSINDPNNLYGNFANSQNLILHDEALRADPKGVRAIYYNQALSAAAQTSAIQAIQLFTKRYPNRKANVIIEEATKKAGKMSKKALVNALNELGIAGSAYTISVYRG